MQMLMRCCQDDLIGLKVTNTLHHLSFRRGIEVLRQNNFSQTCLKRRPSPDEVITNHCDNFSDHFMASKYPALQLRTGGFYCCKVLLSASRRW